MSLSAQSARNMILASQGLLSAPAHPAQKEDVLKTINQMGLLQIDTIHVVARSPYLVLWSRLGSYCCEWLDEHLSEGSLFEYWAHAMCFIPREDYPLYRRLQLENPDYYWHGLTARTDDPEAILNRVLEQIRVVGPHRSADFVQDEPRRGNWWDWKDEKIALEILLTRGDLMVVRREKFQRIYDLRQRVRPDWDDANAPDLETVHEAFTLKSVRALGITPARWVPDYYRQKKNGTAARLDALVDAGRLHRVEVDGWEGPAYVHPDRLDLLAQAQAGELEPTYTTLLSPFDPLVWDRERTRRLFNFDYSIECYLPAAKRRYGYFSLPILHRGELVGRLDSKAHRKERRLEVKIIHLEPGCAGRPGLAEDLGAALRRFADWHGLDEITVGASDPSEFGPAVAEEARRA